MADTSTTTLIGRVRGETLVAVPATTDDHLQVGVDCLLDRGDDLRRLSSPAGCSRGVPTQRVLAPDTRAA